MPVRKITAAALIVGIGLLVTQHSLLAQESKSRMDVPKGAKVEINGSTARISGGVSGTFKCTCAAGGSGTCELSATGSVLICQNGTTGSCSTECRLTTTTTSAAPGRMQMPGALKQAR